MAKINYGVSPTSAVLRVKLMDSSSTTGAGLTGLTFESSGLIISTIKTGEATATAYTVAAGNVETIATLGTYAAPSANKCRFKEVDSTNHKGLYELQFADARMASTDSLIISIVGATNLAQADFEIQCTNLTANLIQILSTAVSTPATAGILDVNLKNIANATVNTASAQVGVNVVSQDNIDFGALQKASLDAATPASVGSIEIGGIVAGSFAAGAINAAAIADDAIDAGAIAANAITSAKIATDAIGAAQIAADAIGASEFTQAAADKVWSSAARTLTAFSTSLAVSVWDVLVANITTASSIGKKIIDWLAGTDTSTPTVNATKLAGQTITAAAGVTFPSSVASPTNITGGTIDTVTNLTNAPTNGDLTATMKTSITTAATAATPTAAAVTGNVGGNVVGSVGSVVATVAANLTQILGTALTETAGYLAAGFKKFFNIATPVATVASIDQTGDSYGVVKSGGTGDAAAIKAKTDNLPASPAATGAQMDLVNAPNATALTAIGTAVWATTARTLTSFGTVVADVATAVWSAVTRSLTDKAGFTISGTKQTLDALNDITAASVRTEMDANSTKLDATISSRLASASYTAPDNTGIGNIKTQTDKLTFDGSNNILSVKNATTAGTADFNATEKAAITAAVPSVIAIRTEMDTNSTKLDVAVSTRLATTGYTAPANSDITAIKAKTDNLPASPAATGAQMDLVAAPNATALVAIGTAVWAATTRTLSSFGTLVADTATAVWSAVTRTLTSGAIPTVAEIADGVWDEQLSGHTTAGSAGKKLADAATDTGSGSYTITVTVKNDALVVQADVLVSVYNAAETLLVAYGRTNVNGQCVFALDAATYHVKLRKAQITFTTPEVLVVTADASVTYTGTVVVVPVPPTGCQTLYGTVLSADGAVVSVGAELVATRQTDSQVVSGSVITAEEVSAVTDTAGVFYLYLVQGAKYRVIGKLGEKTFLEKNITVSADASKDIANY